MINETLIIKNKLGLHARAAAVFVQTTTKFSSEILVEKDENIVDGKSILGMMMLAAGYDSYIKIKINGHDEHKAFQAIKKIIEDKFGEES